jgi:hypothetical protein
MFIVISGGDFLYHTPCRIRKGNNMKKQLISAVAVAAIAVAGLGTYQAVQQDTPSAAQPSVVQQVPKPITFSENKKTVNYDGVAGITALETLKTLTMVDTKASAYGEMITGINGVSADSNSEYWAFYVDGKLASEGAGTYKAQSGDKIEWRLEKL